ncbi:MAG TPA: hydantoinase B/oxoprolinase family protein, partial [Candidatus Binataceae bacterium]|nr:hydantoinase B/oxoprolinase family protein [Candidatus Binataceae bacterium]
QFGNATGYNNFEMAAESFGARGVSDGLDCGSAIWNSEGMQGDAEIWEMTGPNVYLSRAFTKDHQGFGRFRGGSAWESLWMVKGSKLVNVTFGGSGCHSGGFFHKGLFGGYPAPGWKCLWARGTNLQTLINRGEKVPQGLNEAEAMLRSGRIKAEEWYCGPLNQWSPMLSEYDLFGIMYQGGSGYGDPLAREHERITKDIDNGLLGESVARKIYGYAKTIEKTEAIREQMRKKRLAESIPAEKWWKEERRRAKAGRVAPMVSQMFARSAKLSDKIKSDYLAFWKLDEFPYTDTGTVDFHTAAPAGFYHAKSPVKPPKAEQPSRTKRRVA